MTSRPAKAASEVGQQFGPYRVDRKLGRGGFGTTYFVSRVFEGGLTKRFCLKRIHPDVADEADYQASFVHEARVLTLLDAHPGIVQLVDFFERDGCLNLVMELVDGVDAYHLIQYFVRRKRRIPQHIAAYITAELCSALAFAHSLHPCVVHRDLKPQNVFLGFDGHVKLGDFGIAAFAGNKRTRTGIIKGSFSHMSPEHITRHELDAQSDLFSLGAVLYHLLTGQEPFPRDPPAAIAAISEGRFQPVQELAAEVHPDLAALVHRMLEREKSRRPADAREVRAGLLALPFGRLDTRDNLGECVRQCQEVADAVVVPQQPSEPDILEVVSDILHGRATGVTEGLDTDDLSSAKSAERERTQSSSDPASPSRAASSANDVEPDQPGSEKVTAEEVPRRRARPLLRRPLVVAAGLLSAAITTVTLLWPYSIAPHTAPAPAPMPVAAKSPAAVAPQLTTPIEERKPREPSSTAATPITATPAPPTSGVESTSVKHATVTVRVLHFGVISIDGHNHGRAPKTVRLRAGKHAIRILNEAGDHVLLRSEFVVQAGETKMLEYDVRGKQP